MSGTHATTKILDAWFNHENLCVTLNAICYNGDQTFPWFETARRDDGSFPPIAEQMFKGFEDYYESSDIGSVASILGYRKQCSSMLLTLVESGFEDLKDAPAETLHEQPRDAVESKLLACAVLQSDHPDKDEVAGLLAVKPFEKRQQVATENLSDEDVQTLRDFSWQMFKDLYDKHADYTRGLAPYLPEGTDVSDRKWEEIPADVIIAAAEKRASATVPPRKNGRKTPVAEIRNFGDVLRRCPLDDWVVWDWFLLNPSYGQLPPIFKQELFFGRLFVAAALVHHCFIDLRGYNLSPMLSTHVDSIEKLGNDIDAVDVSKPRSKLEDREFTLSLSRRNHLGGFLRAVAAVSKFSRHFRSKWASWEAAGLLYAPHAPKELEEINWSKFSPSMFEKRAAEKVHPGFTLSFRQLRQAAKRLGQAESPDHELHGQSRRTATTYDARCLPPKILHDETDEALRQLTERGRARLTGEDKQALELLNKAVADGEAKDVAVSVCVSDGRHPDAPNEACRKGLAQCFACPNGIRTYDHVPGLIALRNLCLELRQNNVADWETSEAPAVLTAVTAVLTAHPEATDHWTSKFQRDPQLAAQWDTHVAVIWQQRSRKQ